MDTDIRCELKKDFEELLENIDFNSYNPNSSEFQTALRIGLMLHILPQDMKMEEKSMKIETAEKDDISDEIMGAKKYLQKYHETSDSIFKEMSNDELKHAEILIKKAYSKLPNNEEKIRLKNYEDEIKEIKSHLI